MSKSKNTFRRERTTFEWVLLVVSLAVIAAIASALVFYGVSATSEPPDLTVSVTTSGTDHVLVVENKGGTTAEEVVVEVTRGSERQEVEFKAVAKGDVEEAKVALPGGGKPEARVTSFKEP